MGNARILIVEDEWLIAEDLRQRLVRMGYEVTDMVSSGEDALACMERNPADLVMMDIVLAGALDGIETVHRLHQRWKAAVVFLTAYSDHAILDRAKQAEPHGYLVKPFADKDLHTTIEIALHKHKVERELHRRLELEALVADVSAGFVQAGGEQFAAGIDRALSRIGRHFDLDACHLALRQQGGLPTGRLFRWNGKGSDRAPVAVSTALLPSWDQALVRGEVVAVNCAAGGGGERLPQECDWMRENGLGSVLRVPVIGADGLIGVMGFDSAHPGHLWPEGDVQLLTLVAEMVATVWARDEAEARTSRLASENRNLAQRLISIQEDERHTLARELHDELAQWLTGIQADAEAIVTLNGERDRRIHECARAIADASRQVSGVVRRMMGRLRPQVLEDLGLADALRELTDAWSDRHPEVDCRLECGPLPGKLDEELAITVFRLVQEALTNVARHAAARKVRIKVGLERRERGERLSVWIEDDGRGMSDSERGRGLGLVGMRERVMAVGGELSIDGAPGRGVRIRADLPMGAIET